MPAFNLPPLRNRPAARHQTFRCYLYLTKLSKIISPVKPEGPKLRATRTAKVHRKNAQWDLVKTVRVAINSSGGSEILLLVRKLSTEPVTDFQERPKKLGIVFRQLTPLATSKRSLIAMGRSIARSFKGSRPIVAFFKIFFSWRFCPCFNPLPTRQPVREISESQTNSWTLGHRPR